MEDLTTLISFTEEELITLLLILSRHLDGPEYYLDAKPLKEKIERVFAELIHRMLVAEGLVQP